MCRILRVNKDIEELTQNYFYKAYQHESFLKVSLAKKEVLGGCCVLVSCRQNNWPITVGTICCLLEAEPALVRTVYLELVKILNIEAPVTNLMDVMESHSQE